MTVPYGENLFTYSAARMRVHAVIISWHQIFLVLCNRLAAVIFAVAMATAKGESMSNQAIEPKHTQAMWGERRPCGSTSSCPYPTSMPAAANTRSRHV